MDELIRRHPGYELRLYTLTLVKISITFWERQEIKNEVGNFFSKNWNYEWKPKEWHEIIKKVLHFADASDLAATISLDLKDAIINTGMKMFDWIMYVHWDYGLDITHALPILWTSLGFVDEDKIFKSIWVKDASLYQRSPDKPIFRLACMLAQEDFIREHANEMIEELKKLLMVANSDDDVELEVVDYSDKVYGIMSTYISYFVHWDWVHKDYYFYASGFKTTKEELKQREIEQQSINDGPALRNSLDEAMSKGLILSPEIMAKLSGWPGLIHAVKYYLKKLNHTQKKEVMKWLLKYFRGRILYNIHCRAWRFSETVALVIEQCEHDVLEDCYFDHPLCRLLSACPLESVLWPMFKKFLNNVETTHEQLHDVLKMTFTFMEVDQYLEIPNRRYFYQKLLKKIFATFNHRKMQSELYLLGMIEAHCCRILDFTWLRTVYETKELIKFEGDAERFRQELFSRLQYYFDPHGIPNFEVFEKFFDQLFDYPDDRIRFLVEMFPQCRMLRECEFDMWEKLYSTLNIIPAPLWKSIDPIKCLHTLASDNSLYSRTDALNIKNCEDFIKWWHGSNPEGQVNLKEKFKESSFPPECIYKYWLVASRYKSVKSNWVEEALCHSLRLLQWLFDSEDEITKFKMEKLSVLGLLHTSLTLSDELYNASSQENTFYKAIDEFIIFLEVTAERLDSSKDEIRSKIEELIYNFLTVHNIQTFNFLMNWVSLSEERKKRIFQNLMDSSKMLKLCEQVLNKKLSEEDRDLFYNEWLLRYCDDISKLKRYLIANYKGVRSDCFIWELFAIYETLERGERFESIEKLCHTVVSGQQFGR